MLQFHHVVLPKRSCGSSTGQGERASVERPFAVDHLQDTVSLGNEGQGERTNASSCLFRLTLGEECLRPQVNTSNNCFAQVTYPNRFEYYPVMPHDLTEQVSERYKQPIEQALRTFHDFLHITNKTIDHTQRLCNGYSSLVLC